MAEEAITEDTEIEETVTKDAAIKETVTQEAMINVEVAYALAERQALLEIQVPVGTTALEAAPALRWCQPSRSQPR